MQKHARILIAVMVVAILMLVVACGEEENLDQGYGEESIEQMLSDAGFPQLYLSESEIGEIIDSPRGIPVRLLSQEVLIEIAKRYGPEEYYIDDAGLHWDEPEFDQSSTKGCYGSYGFSMVGYHFVYWMYYRPPSYDTYIAWSKVWANPYGSNGVLVQKRDMCWICGCSPWCVKYWIKVCSK